ncbi:unnamed protein product [Boreogadus saida]
MQRYAYLCSEVNGEGNDPEVDGPKRQEARVQEEGHGLLLSPRQGIASTKRQPSSVRPPITGQFLCVSGCLAHMGGSRPQFAVGGAAAALVDVQQQQAGAFGLRHSTMDGLLHSENGWGDTRQQSLL